MKKKLISLLAGIAIFSFTACSSNKEVKDTSVSTENKTITIGLMPDSDSVPFVIADKKGYYGKERVEVKLEYFKSAKDRDSAFQSGKLDGIVTDILAVNFYKEGNFDVKITSKTDGNYKLLAAKNSGINSVKDMKGKSIAISQNTLIEYATDKLLEAGKVNGSDVNKQAVPQIPVRLEMLQNDKVDAATLPEPMATLAVKNGAKFIDSLDKYGINPGVMVFTSKSIKENSNEIKSIYKAYNNAVDYINGEDVSNYVDILIKDIGFPEDIKGSIKLPKYTKAEMPKEKDITQVVDWMKSKNLIKNSYEFKDLVDEQFVR